MARRNGVAVSICAILFGAVAVVLSILAYNKRIKNDEVTILNGECHYPHNPSFALGIVAAIALLVEQVIISSGIGCLCCGKTRSRFTCCGVTSIVFFLLSWVSFVIAFLGLLATSVLNNHHYLATNYTTVDGHSCKTGKDNLFLGTTIWCIFTIVLGLVAYITFKAGARGDRGNQRAGYYTNEQGNIAMGQYQMQPK